MISAGSSAGTARVIGVATATVQGAQNLNWGVPVEYVYELLSNTSPVPFGEFAAVHQSVEQTSFVVRDVPNHSSRIWSGCDETAINLVGHDLGEAIRAGAVLFNEGKPALCYQLYAGTAVDVVRRLPAACDGPRRALEAGLAKAAPLTDAARQAWAMRDAFDGLAQALVRRLMERRR